MGVGGRGAAVGVGSDLDPHPAIPTNNPTLRRAMTAAQKTLEAVPLERPLPVRRNVTNILYITTLSVLADHHPLPSLLVLPNTTKGRG